MALNRRVLLVPHFPALLLDEKSGEECRIHEILRDRGAAFRSEGAQVAVILSAGWDEEGPFQVDNGARLKTLANFDGVDADVRYRCDGWTDLGNALHENGLASGLPVETVHRGMDHSASVPLSYLFPEADRKVILLSASQRGREDLRRWGTVVRETCRGAGAECVILVGASISYDPAAFRRGEERREGVELDKKVLSRLEAGDWEGLAALPGDLMTAAPAHVQLRYLWFLEGVLGEALPGRVLAYRRHPGVGSAVVEFERPE